MRGLSPSFLFEVKLEDGVRDGDSCHESFLFACLDRNFCPFSLGQRVCKTMVDLNLNNSKFFLPSLCRNPFDMR